MMNLVEQTRDWLSNNHIIVPEDWLQACVEWIQEENQGRNLSGDDIQSLVYEQWLLSDLHELEVECLPNAITSASKFELTGTFALQVDSVLDVGLSYYSQQQKMKGTENANAKVSADEPSYKPWEQKPSRMLMFKLTDGKQQVQGMEYRPISCLTPQTQPGTKVLIHGSVLCRYGVLMLSEANIKNLGGEVDTLVEANSGTNALQAAMEASAQLANKSHRQEFQGSEIRNNKSDIKQEVSGQYSQVQRPNRSQAQGPNRLSTGNQLKMKTEIMSQQGTGNYVQGHGSRNNNSISSVQNGDNFDDDFIEDIDFDDDFEETCMQTFKTSSNSRNVPQQSGTHRQTSNQSNVTKNRLQGGKANGISQVTKSSQSSHGHFPERSLHSHQQHGCDNQTRRNHVNDRSVTGDELGNVPRISQSAPFCDTADFDNDDIDFEDDDIDLLAAAEAQMVNKERDQGRNTLSVPGNERSQTITEQRQDRKVIKTEKPSGQSMKRAANPTSFPSSDVHPPVPNKIQKIKAEQHAILKSQPSLDVDSEYPFTYLSKIMAASRQATPTYHTVKAYISTLTGKLSSQNNRWTLSCKINDGTMAVDVDLSTKVLTELIGFSPQQAQEMKKRISRDPHVKDILKKGLQQCQQKLIDLICLMELELSTSNTKPVIVATKQLTSNTADMLYNRVMSNWDKLKQ